MNLTPKKSMSAIKYTKWFKAHNGVKTELENQKWTSYHNGRFYSAYTEIELIRDIAKTENLTSYYQYKNNER